jgi:hypothetical protein
MKTLLAVGTLIALGSAPFGAISGAFAQSGTRAASLTSDAAIRYEAEAALFDRIADRYAMDANQYRAAGKPITTTEAKRYADLSASYRQRAARDLDLAQSAR